MKIGGFLHYYHIKLLGSLGEGTVILVSSFVTHQWSRGQLFYYIIYINCYD